MKKEKNEIILKFDLDSFEILKNDDDVSIVKLRLLHLGENRNKCDITKECCDDSMPTLLNKPITYRLNNRFFPNNSTDVEEHARGKDETMQIAGVVPESTTIEYVFDEEKSKTYLEATGIIYKIYQPTLMEILKNRDGNVKVSIEIIATDAEKKDNGILLIKKMRYRGITLLGDKIVEGIEGSEMNVIRFSKELSSKYSSFSKDVLTYEIPQSFKKEVNSLFESYKKDSKGLTEKDLIIMNSLIKKDSCNIDEIHNIKSCFDSINNKLNENLNLEWVNSIMENEVEQMRLSVSELRQKIWMELDKFKYREDEGDYDRCKYYLAEIYTDGTQIIVNDNQEQKTFMINYNVNDGIISLDMDSKKEVQQIWVEKDNSEVEDENAFLNAYVFSKQSYGSGSIVKVDKSENSVSDAKWSGVDKSSLRKKVLDASNYKTLVKDIYLQVEDGWEDSPSSKLKYPVMEIIGEKAVYNRNALSSAKGFAEAENDTEVIKKISSIYKKLGLDEKKKEGKSVEKEKEDAIVKNKLDKKSKVIGKIKDDVDAGEDDEKEKLKKNKEDDDIEDLEDDEDADKDYWKKKYSKDMELKNAEIETMRAKCNSYEEKELKNALEKLLKEAKEDEKFSEDDTKELDEAMKNSKTEEEFSAKIYAKIKENKKKEKEKIVKNSAIISPWGANSGYEYASNSDIKDINDLAKFYRTKGEN